MGRDKLTRRAHACARSRAAVIALAALALLAIPAGAETPTFELGRGGLRSLRYAGVEFIERQSLGVHHVVMKGWDGATSGGGAREEKREVDAERGWLVLAYAWGEVFVSFSAEEDCLRITVDVLNTGDAIISELGMELAAMRFPKTPRGWVQHMPYRAFNLGAPTAIVADCGEAVVAACNEDVGRPLLFGWAGRQSTTQRPLIMGTASDWMQHMLNPMMYRPVPPGGRDRFEVTLRFAPGGTPPRRIVSDLWTRFARAHPYRLEWKDRRPIGALHLSSSDMKIEKNPRGWFNDREADFLSDTGRAEFRRRLIERARSSVEILKSFDAQGMITWDIEGQEYPHATSYIGDPRSLPPEMEPVADEYFKTFADAGLRTGLTLRPQIPVRTAYGEGVRQIEVADPFSVLDAKLSYAKKRWGCTLYYVDSNGDPNVPFPAEIFSRLAAKHPEVLLIPEHENPQYYTSGAPYRCYGNLKQFGTPEHVRQIYPQAFACLAVAHADPGGVADRIVEDVRRGDIIIVNAWYSWPGLESVKRIYERAGR